MLINRNTKIIGDKVVLVPYRAEHVPKYHQWMQSPELQQLTASEPLSLEQEYEMQKSWMVDNDKLTFIILDRKKFEETGDEIASMIGDTNLFFVPNGVDGVDSASVAEAEIMIAETWARRNHCGFEAMYIMLYYGILKLNIRHYIVKISETNTISQQMFRQLGFVEVSLSTVFNEVTMEMAVNETVESFLTGKTIGIQIVEQPDM